MFHLRAKLLFHECFTRDFRTNMSINVSKTQAMILEPRSKLHQSAPVKFVKQYNYLRIIMDSEMAMLKHRYRVKQSFSTSMVKTCQKNCLQIRHSTFGKFVNIRLRKLLCLYISKPYSRL